MEQITIASQVDSLSELLDFIGVYMQNAEVNEPHRNKIILAAAEIFANVVSYAYPSTEGEVTVLLEIKNGQFIMEFRDSGKPFNPLDNKDPDLTTAAKDREIGGLGIYMIKMLMNDVRYVYHDDQNVLTTVYRYKGADGLI